MATNRRYDDACGMAQALNVVGERWALLVVRELLLGPKRFSDLRADLPGVSPNVLADRLEELERRAVLRRRKLPPPAGSWVYELTEWGAELEPVIITIGRWGARSPFLDREAGLSVSSAVLAMRTMFSAERAAGVRVRIEIRMGERRFLAEVDDGRFVVTPVERLAAGTGTVDAVVSARPEVLAGLLYDGLDLGESLRAGTAEIEGDVAAVERYLGLFALPPAAPALRD